MRRIIGILSLLVCFLCVKASSNENDTNPTFQVAKDYKDSTEFSVTGTKWYARHHYSGPMSSQLIIKDIYRYYLETDTLIDGHVWKKLYKEGEFSKETLHLGYLRETEGQVWFYPEKILESMNYPYREKEPCMLYDFSLQKGDTVYWNYWQMGYTHTPVSDVYHNNTMTVMDVRFENGRKIIDFGYEQWIEGIGSSSSAFLDIWLFRPTDGSSSWEEPFQVVTDRGELVYFQREILSSEPSSGWLKDGMTWHEYHKYVAFQDECIYKTSLSQGKYMGRFNVTTSYLKYFVYLQEANEKVYAFTEDHNVELCYDFSLKEGETVNLLKTVYFVDIYPKEYDRCTVSKVDSVEISGEWRKRITLIGDREDVWVEGIGSLTRVFPLIHYYEQTTADYTHLTCCYDSEKTLYLHPDYTDCTTSKTHQIEEKYLECTNGLSIIVIGQSLFCTSSSAVKLEVYTVDAVKVGEAAFANGEASVTVGKTPATYLYIVTYPDGRRESGKVVI